MSITERLAAIAKLLLGDVVLTATDRQWVRDRDAHGDWDCPDETRMREILPADIRPLLYHNGREDLE